MTFETKHNNKHLWEIEQVLSDSEKQPSIISLVKDIVDSLLEKIGKESHLEGDINTPPPEPITTKVHLYRFIFKSFLSAKLLRANFWDQEIYPTKEVKLSYYGPDTPSQSDTAIISIPGILTETTQNNEQLEQLYDVLQTRENGTQRTIPIANAVIVPNYYYNARNLEQVEYFWEYLADLVTKELERFGKVVLVGHSFGGILSTALAHELVKRGVSPEKLGVITYCTPHGEAPLTRKTHFQPARDLIGYQPEQAPDVSTVAFVGENDKWVWSSTAEITASSGNKLKARILPKTGHDGDIVRNRIQIAAAVRAVARG